MENLKHTHGEWRINRTGQDNIIHITTRRPNERQDIATIETPTEQETIANAKLISAAPDLLKALLQVVSDDPTFLEVPLIANAIKKATE